MRKQASLFDAVAKRGKRRQMHTIGDILEKFNPVEDKYVSREFQSYGIYLAEELGDYKHRGLYIKLAKTVPRAILERSLTFVKDSKATSKAKLFMWKMKKLKDEMNEKQKPKKATAAQRRLVLKISGRVQGVGYRAWMKDTAVSLGVMGWVKNVPDGRVFAVAEGPEHGLNTLITLAGNGPASASVSHVDTSWQPATGEFESFAIVRR